MERVAQQSGARDDSFDPGSQRRRFCHPPSALRMVETTPHYVFRVACISTADGSKCFIPCQKVVALVRSKRNSTPTPLGDGFKLITPDVEDLLSTEDDGQMKRTLSAICTLENLTQYKIDPPRGKTQHALVIVTGKTDASFVVESVQLLSPEEAAQAKQPLQKGAQHG